MIRSEFTARLASTPEADIAWFAGWLCADGCVAGAKISRPPRRDTFLVSIKFTLTDKDPLDRFAELFGGSVSGPHTPSSAGWGVKDTWYWSLSGENAIALLKRVDPWLSVRYRERAQTACAGRDTYPRGRKLTPELVAEISKKLVPYRHGLGKELAIEYGVSQGRISQIRIACG